MSDISENGRVGTSEKLLLQNIMRILAKIIKMNFLEFWKLNKGLQQSMEYSQKKYLYFSKNVSSVVL